MVMLIELQYCRYWLYILLPLVTKNDEPKERIIDEDVYNNSREMTDNREGTAIASSCQQLLYMLLI